MMSLPHIRLSSPRKRGPSKPRLCHFAMAVITGSRLAAFGLGRDDNGEVEVQS